MTAVIAPNSFGKDTSGVTGVPEMACLAVNLGVTLALESGREGAVA